MDKKIALLFLCIVLLFSFQGCYTSFSHPPIKDARWGDVQLSDDCSACHDNQRFSIPVLPEAAYDDNNWQFYSGSAWWQDDYSMDAGVSAQPDGSTGPRTISNSPMTPAPVAMPVQGGSQSLGKQSAPAQEDQAREDKRSIGRRSNTSESSEKTVEEKSSSRSRRD